MTTRRERIIRMRKSGLTQTEIGKIMGVTGERVRQIIVRKTGKMAGDRFTERPLSTGDVARLLNIHTNTVRRWCRSGMLKSYRVGPRGDRRFVRSDVVRLLQESET